MKIRRLPIGSLPRGGKKRRDPEDPAPPAPPAPPPAPRRRWIWLLVAMLLPALAGLGWGAWLYKTEVLDYTGEDLGRAQILSVIAQESPVLYRDGQQRMGVFFDQEHREYLSYGELPEDWVHAILAAEDSNFFYHPGLDPKHILRAAWTNAQAGRVVAGGSTLSQQTAKNIYYRPDRSWKSKWIELLYTLRLEDRYSKQDILEFYANQFHVSANGRGLAIAARYFFNVPPEKLTLKQCAFIAGMVKAPSRYNPFIGSSPERRARAQQLAEDRTAYVLRRMAEVGYILPERLPELLAVPLTFSRGTFQYDRSVLLDSVEGVLEQSPFDALFSEAGIDSPATAGIRVISTIDSTLQREATWALWHHLSTLGPVLERLGPAALALPDQTPPPPSGEPLLLHDFHIGEVTENRHDQITLDLSGRPCVLGAEQISRVAHILAAARTGDPDAPADAESRAALATLAPGTVVLAGVAALPPDDPARCDLEIRSKLQGAVVVLEEGKVRALVGGSDNRNFNRALSAERQFGSTWKPPVYHAALQLGWLPDDLLDNRRNAFPFRDVWYYPGADHRSDAFLTMSDAGARSENLASVWLLYHLTDRLDAGQFRMLAGEVGLWPSGEDTTSWLEILKKEAIRSSPERYEEYALTLARQEVIDAPPFPEDALALRSLLHGAGSAAERAKMSGEAGNNAAKLATLDNSLLGLEALMAACRADPAMVWEAPATGATACGESPGEGFVSRATLAAHKAALPPPPPPLPPPPPPKGLGLSQKVELPPVEALPEPVTEEFPPQMLVGGRIRLGTLQALRAAVDRHAAALQGRDPWSPEVLALNPDFRILVGIRWLQRQIQAAGITADIPTVMSLPLGAADLRLIDAASLYQLFFGGNRWRFRSQGAVTGSDPGLRVPLALPDLPAAWSMIERIEDASGNLLYGLIPDPVPAADPVAGEMTGDILRAVVLHGTGRRAATAVKVAGAALPLAGKTGTTNDYRNAAFIGFVPKYTDGAARWGSGYTVAVYVGYDDNRSMRRGSFRVQGASGALPIWINTAQGLVNAGMVGTPGAQGADWVPSDELERGAPPADQPPGHTSALTPAGHNRRYALPQTPITTQPAPGEVIPELPPPALEELPPEEGTEPFPG